MRHTNIVPADRAFYEAGLHCRQARKHDMALMFLNRFLDLVEAIENDDGMLDPEGFQEKFEFNILNRKRRKNVLYFSFSFRYLQTDIGNRNSS